VRGVNPISRRIVGFGFLTSLASIAFPALAATTPPIRCRVLGETTTYKGKLYTCIKTKSKGKTVLAWDSGKVIPAAAATSSSTPTPTASPTQTAPTPVVVKKIEIPIAKSSEVPNNSTKSFVAKNRHGNSTTYIVIRKSDGLLALDATCPHKGCIVAVESEGLLCPCHNALFDPKNGDVLRGPASYPLDRLPVYEAEGVIYITD
jgi:Rieske Fe-S protein